MRCSGSDGRWSARGWAGASCAAEASERWRSAGLLPQAEAERRERERAAASHERLVIGRELQDIIAHDISVMVIQAAAARQLLDGAPERAGTAIASVETTGREALAEMRRLLGLLRRDDDPRALVPQPGLGQLEDLAETWRAAGRTIDMRISGAPEGVTPGVDLVGYRVVEAVLADAAERGCRTATAVVDYSQDQIALRIIGDGVRNGHCRRLDTITDRVRLYDGSLEVSDTQLHGFAVDCRLPLGEVCAA